MNFLSPWVAVTVAPGTGRPPDWTTPWCSEANRTVPVSKNAARRPIFMYIRCAVMGVIVDGAGLAGNVTAEGCEGYVKNAKFLFLELTGKSRTYVRSRVSDSG